MDDLAKRIEEWWKNHPLRLRNPTRDLGKKVNIDHHVAVEANYYSVPYQLIREEVDVRLTAHTVEIFRKGRRVASHARSNGRGHYQTDPAHRPQAHQRYLDWAPSRLIRWATTVGPHTAALVEAILQEKPHPEQGYRACLGILGSGNTIPASAWRRRRSGHWAPVRTRTAASSRSSSTASTS